MSNPITVLVVDGDAHSLMTLSALLKTLDIHYKRNTSGTNVIAQAHAMLPQLDAILLDMHLPETDAYDICQALKQDPRLRRIPIIIMTHQLTEDLPQRVRQNGCAGLVVRPFSRKQFGVYLRRIVSGDRPVGNGVH